MLKVTYRNTIRQEPAECVRGYHEAVFLERGERDGLGAAAPLRDGHGAVAVAVPAEQRDGGLAIDQRLWGLRLGTRAAAQDWPASFCGRKLKRINSLI